MFPGFLVLSEAEQALMWHTYQTSQKTKLRHWLATQQNPQDPAFLLVGELLMSCLRANHSLNPDQGLCLLECLEILCFCLTSSLSIASPPDLRQLGKAPALPLISHRDLSTSFGLLRSQAFMPDLETLGLTTCLSVDLVQLSNFIFYALYKALLDCL